MTTISGLQRREEHIELSYNPNSPDDVERIRHILTAFKFEVLKQSPGHVVARRSIPVPESEALWNVFPDLFSLEDANLTT